MDRDLARAAELDRRVADVGASVRVLGHLTWSPEVGERFLASWARGAPELPVVEPIPANHRRRIEQLDSIMPACDLDHPVGAYVQRTAASYRDASHMMEAIGTPDFTRWSIALYGQPSDRIPGTDLTNLDAADHVMRCTDGLATACLVRDAESTIPATSMVELIRSRIDRFFGPDTVRVALDPMLAAKAVAGGTHVRIRRDATFSELDVEQLVQHEAFVHTATLVNGRRQPNLPTLGLGAPRTTWTQEGLATFAELATMAIDLIRLRRIALRVQAVDHALNGADFIEVFRFFLDAGQPERESYQSTMRVFRGGDVRGTIVFTKDIVYLKGLLLTHAFLHKAIEQARPQLLRLLFAGRLTLGDVVALAPFYDQGWVVPPRFTPDWVTDQRRLAANLTYSVFANRIDLDGLAIEDIAAA